MGFSRFMTGLWLGLVLSICLACAETVVTQPDGPTPTVEPPAATVPATAPDPPLLSAEVTALVASASPNPMVDPPRKDVRLVVMSDLNGVYGSTDYDPEVDKAIALMPFWRPDMVLCSGDMVAGQDLSLSPDQLNAMWSAFDDHVAAPLRQANLPYGFTIGNHDASGAQGINSGFLFQQERDVAAAYWNDPQHDPGLTFVDRFEFPFYYTFTSNDIFFLAWDGSASKIPADKLAWVESALASPAAQQAKMRVLLGHLPLYAVAVGRNAPGEVMDSANQLQDLLERYDVHTYISGHHHAYYPGHSGELQLLHMGILGSGPRPLLDSNLPAWKALTVIDVDFADPALTTYTTYDIQTLQTIPIDQLPRFITGHNGLVLRRDVAYTDLDASEKALCEQRLGPALCTQAEAITVPTYRA